MSIISPITEHAVVDGIIHHLKLTFVAERLPTLHIASREILMAAETSAEYFSCFYFHMVILNEKDLADGFSI